jgi:hypothetical protein
VSDTLSVVDLSPIWLPRQPGCPRNSNTKVMQHNEKHNNAQLNTNARMEAWQLPEGIGYASTASLIKKFKTKKKKKKKARAPSST